MFKNHFSSNGRIRRLEYCISYIIYIVASFIAGFIAGIITLALDVGYYEQEMYATILSYVLWFPCWIWFLMQGAKRCHDRNCSGWWQIVPFYVFWMMFADGTPGQNDYGENPKGIPARDNM